MRNTNTGLPLVFNVLNWIARWQHKKQGNNVRNLFILTIFRGVK